MLCQVAKKCAEKLKMFKETQFIGNFHQTHKSMANTFVTNVRELITLHQHSGAERK